MARLALTLALALLLPLFGAPASRAAEGTDADLGAYPLDGLSRTVAPTGKIVCPEVDLIDYRGAVVRFASPVRVYPGFAERLRRFEELVAEVGVRVFGRAPKAIRHLGGFYCRRIARYPDLLSEHGLGNGIDIAGFDFGPLPKGAAAPEGLPKSLRRTFGITLKKDWDADPDAAAHKARFLRQLTDALSARDDIFRVLLGPAYPGHKDHFHFDCAPYRLIVL